MFGITNARVCGRLLANLSQLYNRFLYLIISSEIEKAYYLIKQCLQFLS